MTAMWTSELPAHLQRFDVVRLNVMYEEGDGRSKKRPVIVVRVSSDGVNCIGVKVTSTISWDKAGDVVLGDSLAAGLDHVSLARCSQMIVFPEKKAIGYYGELSRADRERVARAIADLRLEDIVWLHIR